MTKCRWYWLILYIYSYITLYIYICMYTCMSNGNCGYCKNRGKNYLPFYSIALNSRHIAWTPGTLSQCCSRGQNWTWDQADGCTYTRGKMPLCTLASSSDTERLGNLRNQKYLYCFRFFKQFVLIFVFFWPEATATYFVDPLCWGCRHNLTNFIIIQPANAL